MTLSSGCVTLAFLYRSPIGRMKRSYLTGRRVKSGPTDRKYHQQVCFQTQPPSKRRVGIPNVGFVIILFHPFFAVFFPVFTTLNISSSAIPLTLGKGTLNLAAFSALLFLIALDSAFAFVGCDLSSRYCGSGVDEGSAGADDLTLRSSWALICFFIWIFSAWRFFW